MMCYYLNVYFQGQRVKPVLEIKVQLFLLRPWRQTRESSKRAVRWRWIVCFTPWPL